jgi:tRNA(Ile2) C34 agmatinyltransferase TiaS
MLSGLDHEGDEMGLIRHEEFVCGDCMAGMADLGNHQFQCPKCATVFQDS